MGLDFRNTNTLWASVIVETLQRLGVKLAVICPGSRSGPLAIAFATAQMQAIPVLDERSAAFFALGVARQSKQPVVLVCTSGTAGANFYPAVIEARESCVPLLVLTADRPPELRNCNAGQAIDQQKLYGSFPKWYAELATPSAELSQLTYLRQTCFQAWEHTQWPDAGPVHLNVPFRDPLAPIPEENPQLKRLSTQLDATHFFSGLDASLSFIQKPGMTLFHTTRVLPLLETWQACSDGIIIGGLAQPNDPEAYCRAIARLSHYLGWPVLAEGLSPLRNYADLTPNLVSTYDILLRNPTLQKELQPKMVIRIGEVPTNKELRLWLNDVQPRCWIFDPTDRNLDPLHGVTTHLRFEIERFTAALPPISVLPNPYLQRWQQAEAQMRSALDDVLTQLTTNFEGKVAWLLSQTLPARTPIFIASSTPVRDVEFFWKPNNLGIRPFFNRGANGIDGTLSTALGIGYGQPGSVLLTGDLALLHDTNGFLLRPHWQGHLTIVLINNNGGGIFEMLPFAQFEPPFEEFFATPQSINVAHLCQTYNIDYELITDWSQLQETLNPLPSQGIRVLEFRSDRRRDAVWRQEHLTQLALNVSINSHPS
jgi:2-succinyl-5-enolpyruvyl-6-hydroxy-3-cyclohexene-1-carboxylate synthase